ncbi:MAG: MucB/RseB C-terminal domain-containing protein [Gammaproteobacteria bacterium]|nr:MucB/RseB C-terminal domain-containing protein [Gammaproteobacteria bacterium]
MTVIARQALATAGLAATCFAIGCGPLHAAESPQEWLEKMSVALAETDFEGTLLRRQNGETEALKLIHKRVDGVINERVVSQEGNGLEIIRVGNEVHCIVPDRKSVLIEHWNDQTTMLPRLPGDADSIGPQYNLAIVREERVAGRNAVLLAIRPHDEFRFGHRFWLDEQTAFPLRAELVDGNGVLLEQIKFADISLGSTVPAAALKPSIDLAEFTWYTDRVRPEPVPVATDWVCDDLPAGFRIMSSEQEKLTGSEAPVTHIVYGDGLATVSVFIAERRDEPLSRRHSIGATNTFSADAGEYQVTVVGEVPEVTVRRIALSMRRDGDTVSTR